MDLTLDEVEEFARKSKENARIVTLYKQKCKATILKALLKDSRNLAKFWELEYSSPELRKEEGTWE